MHNTTLTPNQRQALISLTERILREDAASSYQMYGGEADIVHYTRLLNEATTVQNAIDILSGDFIFEEVILDTIAKAE